MPRIIFYGTIMAVYLCITIAANAQQPKSYAAGKSAAVAQELSKEPRVVYLPDEKAIQLWNMPEKVILLAGATPVVLKTNQEMPEGAYAWKTGRLTRYKDNDIYPSFRIVLDSGEEVAFHNVEHIGFFSELDAAKKEVGKKYLDQGPDGHE